MVLEQVHTWGRWARVAAMRGDYAQAERLLEQSRDQLCVSEFPSDGKEPSAFCRGQRDTERKTNEDLKYRPVQPYVSTRK
jgi:hypothetical protein